MVTEISAIRLSKGQCVDCVGIVRVVCLMSALRLVGIVSDVGFQKSKFALEVSFAALRRDDSVVYFSSGFKSKKS